MMHEGEVIVEGTPAAIRSTSSFTTSTWDVITPPMSETEATRPALRVDGLNAYYSGAHVLHGVSFEMDGNRVVMGVTEWERRLCAPQSSGLTPPRATARWR